jgi:hypothetical protein
VEKSTAVCTSIFGQAYFRSQPRQPRLQVSLGNCCAKVPDRSTVPGVVLFTVAAIPIPFAAGHDRAQGHHCIAQVVPHPFCRRDTQIVVQFPNLAPRPISGMPAYASDNWIAIQLTSAGATRT